MKLRNKKTGQLGNFIINKDHFECCDLDYVPEYSSLAELNEEWEDYEDVRDYWYVDGFGNVYSDTDYNVGIDEERKEIGNYFETEEEAEKVVEKLKAWKRLKDDGFEFNGGDDSRISYILDTAKWNDELEKDFDLLFGGEE